MFFMKEESCNLVKRGYLHYRAYLLQTFFIQAISLKCPIQTLNF